MSAREELARRFARFEDHQFPGYPDTPALQEAWDELVERGGALVAQIQRALTGGAVDPSTLPRFEVDLERAANAPEIVEFRHYRAELEALVALLSAHCRGTTGDA